MHALRTDGHGTISLDTLEPTTPGPGEVNIAVRAGTVNPIDLVVARGQAREMGLLDGLERVGLGWDLVGTVTEAGPGTDLAPGALVAATVTTLTPLVGALTEQVTLPADHVARVPEGLDPLDAAAIGMNALTAAQALALVGEPRGRSLLVTGAAGGVGGFAVELATADGWKVLGLAREGDRDFVEGAGAQLITAFPQGRTVDVVLDAAPLQPDPEAFDQTVAAALAGPTGGTFLSVLGFLPRPELPGVETLVVGVASDGALLGQLLDRAAAGTLTPRIAGTVPLEEVERAFTAVAEGGHRGRWIVQVA